MVNGGDGLGHAIVQEFFTEMLGRSDDGVSKVGVIYHQSPHFGAGDGGDTVIVARNFDMVGNIPRMKPI